MRAWFRGVPIGCSFKFRRGAGVNRVCEEPVVLALEMCFEAALVFLLPLFRGHGLHVEQVGLVVEAVDLGLPFSTPVDPAEVEELGYRRGKLPQLE
jgi:hypothetical protein